MNNSTILNHSAPRLIYAGNYEPVTYDDTDHFFAMILGGCESLPVEVDQTLSDATPDYWNDPHNTEAQRRDRFLSSFLVALKHGVNTSEPAIDGSLCQLINAAADGDETRILPMISTRIGRVSVQRPTFSEHLINLGLTDDLKAEDDVTVRRGILCGAVYNYIQQEVTFL